MVFGAYSWSRRGCRYLEIRLVLFIDREVIMTESKNARSGKGRR